MAPRGLVLRMHGATACADLQGILFSHYPLISSISNENHRIPEGGAQVKKDMAACIKTTLFHCRYAASSATPIRGSLTSHPHSATS